MPAINVNIKPEIIEWALSQTPENKIDDSLLKNIREWINGKKAPTFHQIEEFSKKSNIPLGYFFLQTPPNEKLELLEYRTIDSTRLINPSRDLIDTIHEMEDIRDWMKSYRQDLGYDKNLVVGCMKGCESVVAVAERIREDLGLANNWYEECRSSYDSFSFIRGHLEDSGVLVMKSGIVGQNTHRALNIEEFRAFALTDNWAPLIFINAVDSDGAKLFSLMHEIAHVWIGEDDLYNDTAGQTEKVKPIERECNAVAAELLVPKDSFLGKWDNSYDNVYEEIKALAKHFHCGESVIARRALDCGKINKAVYNKVVQNTIDNYKRMKESQKSGGNYYNTKTSRLDKCLVRTLCESIAMGRTSFAEACRLTNTSPKTFPEIAHNLGGVGW